MTLALTILALVTLTLVILALVTLALVTLALVILVTLAGPQILQPNKGCLVLKFCDP